MKRFTPFLVLLIIALAPQSAWCQTAGNISGRVTDAQTGYPLPGANVVLKGTGLGASTDLNGNYVIENVPPRSYTIRVSYIGYRNLELAIRVEKGERIKQDFKLEAVALKGQEVVITSQASGQNEAINRQLSSQNIINAVSAARIQELPDANAAESVGRLPGVYLLRQGGQGYEVAIRGLQPKYNEVMIDGVQMPSTGSGDRSVDLSMISSSMLSGIELYNTVTPDMDAAVLGGAVNFQIREAKSTPTSAPIIGFQSQIGYNNLQNVYNDYKFTGSVEDRFLNNRLGLFAQAIVGRGNYTSDGLGGAYYIPDPKKPQVTALGSLNLSLNPRDQHLYDGTLVMDYKLPDGKIDFVNVFGKSDTRTESRSQSYSLTSNSIYYGAGYSPNTLNVITNLLEFKQRISSIEADVKISHSYSENISQGGWNVSFDQTAAGISSISQSLSPVQIAETALPKMNLDNMLLNTVNTSNSFSRQRNITGSIDLERSVNLQNFITTTFKVGGQYNYTIRSYNYNDGSGLMNFPNAAAALAVVVHNFPWMAQPPYNLNPNGTQYLPVTLFLQPNFSYGNFLGGDYAMGPATNLGLISQVVDVIKQYGVNLTTPTVGGANTYIPDVYGSLANNYAGNEYRSAGYVMATVNIGPQITIVPGVRYQGLETSYEAARFYNASAQNPYPGSLPHQDTTITEYNGYWLPDVSLRYKPFSWFDVRLAYTNTIAYPDFSNIIPRIDVFSSSVIWNNYALKPARSQNYDLALSLYDNSIGLLTAGAFLKRIDNMIFATGTRYITNPSLYPGLPGYTKGFTISTFINNPYRVDVWGAEVDWQTHFWYLPGPMEGLVLGVNYTHIFSGADYPYTYVTNTGYPYFRSVYVDTFYTDRLIDQPNDIVNLDIGYDYKGFSTRVSMIYQGNVYSGTAFYNSLRSEKVKYLRWDLSAKQTLPWFGLEAFFDMNDLNNEADIYVIRGSGFPTSEQNYGMTADLGLRWRLQ